MGRATCVALAAVFFIGFLIGLFAASMLLPLSARPPLVPAPEPGEPNFEAILYVEYSSKKVFLEGEVRNVGYKHISSCDVTVRAEPPVTVSLGAIASGQTLRVYEEINITINFGISEYEATVAAKAPDGTVKVKNLKIPNLSTFLPLASMRRVLIEAVALVKEEGGAVIFSIKVRNMGVKPVHALTVKLEGEGEQSLMVGGAPVSDSNPLQPGRTAFLTYTPQGTYNVGGTYIFTISATFSDGSNYTDGGTIMCVAGRNQ